MSDEAKIDGGLEGGLPDGKMARLVALAGMLRPSDLNALRKAISSWPVTDKDKADIVGALMAIIRDESKKKGWRRNKMGAGKVMVEIEKLNMKEVELALKLLGELSEQPPIPQPVHVNVSVQQQTTVMPPEQFAALPPQEKIKLFREMAARKKPKESGDQAAG